MWFNRQDLWSVDGEENKLQHKILILLGLPLRLVTANRKKVGDIVAMESSP